MTTTERIALWEAINRYAQMCGGDTSAATVSGPRERAVADIERLVEKLLGRVEKYEAALRNIADRWDDDTAHSRSHRDDCSVVVCLAKRALSHG